MLDLKINPRLAEYFDELDYGQMAQLEKSLTTDLTSEPILWWHNPESGSDEILDGHHRYGIAKKLRLDIQFHEKHFDSEDAALLFVIRNQTTRRNVSNREQIVKLAVDLEIRMGKPKTKAVQDVAADMGIAESTVWDDIKPKTLVDQFHEDKKLFERDLERVRNKEVEKLKQRAQREGYAEDEGRLESEWNAIEEEIQSQFADASARLESTAESIQTGAEATGGRVSVGGKRRVKKSNQERAAKRNAMKKALSLIGKLQSDVLYFWDKTVGIEADDLRAMLKTFVARVQAEQAADAKADKKRKFGR